MGGQAEKERASLRREYDLLGSSAKGIAAAAAEKEGVASAAATASGRRVKELEEELMGVLSESEAGRCRLTLRHPC